MKNTFELEHVGINTDNAGEAEQLALLLCKLFNLEPRHGQKSEFAGNYFECMKSPFLGKNGHIAMRTPDLKAAMEELEEKIEDIAGIRIVCSFTSDIYRLAEMIGKQNDLTVICVKDYIKNPKVSGYKSFHMHVTVPIFLSDRVVETKVEIQIRTIAMDFWASLEHKIYYKFEGHAPEYISRDLRACAEIVSNLDAKMLQLNEAILEEKEKEEQKKKEE